MSSEFQTDSTTKNNASQRRAHNWYSRWVKKNEADTEYPVEHGEVNYTLDGVSIHPVTTKIQVSFLTQKAREEGNRSGISQ